jgi:hypothetical protein
MAATSPCLTHAQKKAAKLACKVIGWLDERMNCLCDDPMTHAMGAPVGDFYDAWSNQYRGMLAERLQDPNNTLQVTSMLLDEFDQFMP